LVSKWGHGHADLYQRGDESRGVPLRRQTPSPRRAHTHGGSRAFYRPSTDSIHLPPREAFIGTATSSPAETYYSTLLHELVHYSGHETRCNRQLGKRFGDDAYAMEELVAELGAAFLCADLQITAEPRADHAQYLSHWLTVLKADNKAIFTAASKASEAATFLAALQGA
jgi:antirestriction protein ArdC